MPGFLSAYEGTTNIDLGDGYWVKVKKCLSSTELGWAQSAMGADRQRVEGNSQYADLNVQLFQRELIVQSLDSWNLDDEDGTPWPLDSGINTPPRPGVNPYPPGAPRRVSVGRLPAPVFATIYDACNAANGSRTTAEAARFPDGTVGGDPDGDGGTAGAE